jgi:predicted GNAT family acetyltransferase
MRTRVIDNSDKSRYELHLEEGDNGGIAGFAEYELRPERIVFTHTEIDPVFEGHGLGSALAAGALDDVRRRGLAVIPRCPFIRRYIERHPEYANLVHTPAS